MEKDTSSNENEAGEEKKYEKVKTTTVNVTSSLSFIPITIHFT